MKKAAVSLLMCLLLYQTVFGSEAKAEGLSAGDVAAMGAILMDAETGRVLWGKNEHTRLPMASTTKIMTAVVALENGRLDDMVKVSKRASAAPEVKMFLHAGEEIRLEHLLYALMLQSSNDAAVAIAEHVGGSVEQFCRAMTEKAAAIGAMDTSFETPNGLDAENHYSTAYDLAVIARYALENEEFMKIINTKSHTCESNRRTYTITNRNRLLNEFQGANGVKTGFTGRAGQCFVGAAKRGDMQLVSVVLASGWGNAGKEQKWKDTKKILSHGFENYAYEDIIAKDAQAGAVAVERSKTDAVSGRFAEGVMAALTKAEKDSIYIEVDMPGTLRAPIEKGQKLGLARVFIGGELFEEVDILAESGAARHDLKTSLELTASRWLEMGTNGAVNVTLPEF